MKKPYYRVVKFYSNDGLPKRVCTFQTEKEAREYCKDILTQGTLSGGVQWFCGFHKVEVKKK